MLELSTGEVISILLALIALVVGIVAYLRQHPSATPAALDAETARRLQEYQRDRENMDRVERAYAQSNAAQQQTVETLASVVRLIAGLTNVKAIDAAADLLTDITTPGDQSTLLPPVDTPPTAPNSLGSKLQEPLTPAQTAEWERLAKANSANLPMIPPDAQG